MKNEVRYCAIKSETNIEGTITYDKLFAAILYYNHIQSGVTNLGMPL